MFNLSNYYFIKVLNFHPKCWLLKHWSELPLRDHTYHSFWTKSETNQKYCSATRNAHIIFSLLEHWTSGICFFLLLPQLPVYNGILQHLLFTTCFANFLGFGEIKIHKFYSYFSFCYSTDFVFCGVVSNVQFILLFYFISGRLQLLTTSICIMCE